MSLEQFRADVEDLIRTEERIAVGNFVDEKFDCKCPVQILGDRIQGMRLGVEEAINTVVEEYGIPGAIHGAWRPADLADDVHEVDMIGADFISEFDNVATDVLRKNSSDPWHVLIGKDVSAEERELIIDGIPWDKIKEADDAIASGTAEIP